MEWYWFYGWHGANGILMKADFEDYLTMLGLLRDHKKVALQVSGGRDSLAVFYLLREHKLLDRVTVYWLNTDDAFPETITIMNTIRNLAPDFVEIHGKQPEIIARFGMPTDLLPRSCTPIGVATGQSDVLMQDSYSCCARVVMQPMHERMINDGVTLIIRGQRNSDSHKAPLHSGDVELGIQYLFPIETWTDEEVDAYLQKQGAPIHPCYEYMSSMPDCKNCSGWWNENRAAYLQAHHSDLNKVYQSRLDLIRSLSDPQIYSFNAELFGGQNDEQ